MDFQYIQTNFGPKIVPEAHSIFYPNGGSNQTGCDDSICFHTRSYIYYAESMNSNRFVGKRCANYEDYTFGHCENGTVGIMGTLDLNTR